jgi:phosphotriesterase-related protein
MPSLESVTGPVESGDLGFVLVHEHVVCSSAGIPWAWPNLYGGREALRERAVEVLTAVKADGVDTVIDATPFDLGRDIQLLADVSRRSGVTILASTGHWLDASPTLAVRSVGQIADFFIRDLTEGTDDTGIRAAVIKVASEDSVTPFEERVLEAAAVAHATTGAPIMTHTQVRYRIGEKQADILERFGVDPSRVMIGHSDDTGDIEYLTGLAERGYWIGMDRIPCGALREYGDQTIEDRLHMIARLVELGHAGRLMLSHDDPIWAGVLSDADQQRHLDANPHSLSFISRIALPALRKLGVTDGAIRTMTVDNPRRWLAGS